MRAAAILGLGCSHNVLKPFQAGATQFTQNIEWKMGMPGSADDADVVLLFGGDGTIHRHLTQLVGLGLPVLIVPAGSGNDFARGIGLRSVQDSRAAWEKFCRGPASVRGIDLGVISTVENTSVPPMPYELARDSTTGARYFCSVAGVGLDSEVARRANRLPRWLRGHGGYLLTLAPAIFTFAPLPMKILTPAENSAANAEKGQHINRSWTTRSEQPTLLAAFANTPWYGGGMQIAPLAKTDDGLLDICVVGAVGRLKLFSMFPTIYSGTHLKIREVEYFQTARVRVETERPLDVYADGEYVCRTPVEIAIQRAALQVITL